ncbi:hypothetical protein ACJX0J_018937, partial [Zea mays]
VASQSQFTLICKMPQVMGAEIALVVWQEINIFWGALFLRVHFFYIIISKLYLMPIIISWMGQKVHIPNTAIVTTFLGD